MPGLAHGTPGRDLCPPLPAGPLPTPMSLAAGNEPWLPAQVCTVCDGQLEGHAPPRSPMDAGFLLTLAEAGGQSREPRIRSARCSI